MKRDVHYELLKHGRTITAETDWQQLAKVNESLRRKFSALINQHCLITTVEFKKNMVVKLGGSSTSSILDRFPFVLITITFYKW